MGKRIRIHVDQVVSEAELYEDKAPLTTAALWEALPITDRTIQTRWSGDAWRTEGNYELQPARAPVAQGAGPGREDLLLHGQGHVDVDGLADFDPVEPGRRHADHRHRRVVHAE